jgi:hypothetical protein
VARVAGERQAHPGACAGGGLLGQWAASGQDMSPIGVAVGYGLGVASAFT